MKVMFLYPRLLNNTTSVGGVAEVLFALSPALCKLNVKPIIYAGDKRQKKLSGAIELRPGVLVYNGPIIKPRFFISRRGMQPVLDLCRQEQIDVVHAQGTYTAGFMAREIYKRVGIPYVVTSHNDILPTNSRRMHRASVKRRCCAVLQNAGWVTHLTTLMETASHQLFDTREKSTVIPNGIHYETWLPYTHLPAQSYLLGIGRLERGKGFHVLIEMYAKMIARGATAPLLIAGKGSEESYLYGLAKQLGLNVVEGLSDLTRLPPRSVVFTGYVRGEDKFRLIAQSQAVLFATQPDLWEEAFSIVQLETMAAGRPMIASDTAATRYLQEMGLQAAMVAPADVDAWANETLALLSDEPRRCEMGFKNLQAARQFDWDVIAKQYHKAYSGTI